MERHELLAVYRPLDEDGAMKRRVRLALARSQSAPLPSRATRVLRPVLAATALIVMSSVAAAWVTHASERRHAAEVERAIAGRLARARAETHAGAGRAEAVTATILPSAAPSVVASSHRSHGARPEGGSRADAAARASMLLAPTTEVVGVAASTPAAEPLVPAPASPPSVVAAPSAEESKLIMEGLSALRIDHDDERARRAFAKYVNAYPDGVLVEEALAYEIEAVAAQGSTAAAELAADYLRRFPRGRFAVPARHAQKRFGH